MDKFKNIIQVTTLLILETTTQHLETTIGLDKDPIQRYIAAKFDRGLRRTAHVRALTILAGQSNQLDG